MKTKEFRNAIVASFIRNVKMELSKLMLDGSYIKRIEFIDRYDEFFNTMNVEFKLK